MGGSLRHEVRELIARTGIVHYAQVDAWMRGHDPEFSRALAQAGLIGLTWPPELGGRGASNLDRLVLTEELLRVGAPVAAHWISDRQIGPAILRYGSPELQREFLPRMAAAEATFCLGMSEPDSGSDLAAVRTSADLVEGGWRITGTKIWTSHAHRSTHAYVLARTDRSGAKHEGLTEFIVDLSAEGVTVRPILDLAGEHHFNEMTFTDVFVPSHHVIGEVGHGWAQVTEQLAYERGGMERVLSTYPLLAVAADPHQALDVPLSTLGGQAARLATLRAMGVGIAQSMDHDEDAIGQAALLKYLGTRFEQDVVEFFRDCLQRPPVGGTPLTELLGRGIAASPGATLRGGATEVLLTIIGREALSPSRASSPRWSPGDADMVQSVRAVLKASTGDEGDHGLPAIWASAVELGWTGVGVPESAGGSGGELTDLAAIALEMAFAGVSAPVAETAMAARLLAGAGREVDVSKPIVIVDGDTVRGVRDAAGWRLDGVAVAVPWGRAAKQFVVLARAAGSYVAVAVPADVPGITVVPHRNLAGEPRDTISFDATWVPGDAVVASGPEIASIRRTAVALLLAATMGALEAARQAAIEHVRVREQFGKPLAAFQAISHTVARLSAEVAATGAAVREALSEDAADGAGWRVLSGRIVAAQASSFVARSAHQLLGAMGITHEHHLHRATLRLWSWRDELISEREAATRLGAAIRRSGPDVLWDWCVHERLELVADAGPWARRSGP